MIIVPSDEKEKCISISGGECTHKNALYDKYDMLRRLVKYTDEYDSMYLHNKRLLNYELDELPDKIKRCMNEHCYCSRMLEDRLKRYAALVNRSYDDMYLVSD